MHYLKQIEANAQAEQNAGKIRVNAPGAGRPASLTPDTEMLLCLYYLRHYPTFEILGLTFEVSTSQAHAVVQYWLPLLRQALPSSLYEELGNCESAWSGVSEMLSEWELIVDSTEQARWDLTQRVLIVAAQVLLAQGNSQIAYGNEVITSRNTFQKYYDQEELKIYIDQVLGVDAVPAALGIYFVFRDETQAQSFRASRFRSRGTVPKIQLRSKRFEDYQELLAPLMAFMTERGRLPTEGELAEEEALTKEFGNLQRAFQIIVQATNA